LVRQWLSVTILHIIQSEPIWRIGIKGVFTHYWGEAFNFWKKEEETIGPWLVVDMEVAQFSESAKEKE